MQAVREFSKERPSAWEPNMEIVIRRVGKCKVLDCVGQLTLGQASLALRKAIHEAVQDGTSKVVLNLKDVGSIDSSFLGEMISGYVHVTNQGCKLVFLNPSKKILKVITIIGLLTKFEFFDDEQKALEGCESLEI